MKRILFANHAQFEGRATNLGDWAIFEQMVDNLKEEIDKGEIEVVVPSLDVEFTSENYPVVAFRRGGIRGILNTIKWIYKSDIVVIGGGEIVQDKSSLVYIPYQLIRPFIAKLFKKKLFGYAIGVGEPNEISRLGKLQARYVLNMFDIITVRDDKSYDVLTNYLKVKKPKVILTADPALNLTAKVPTSMNEQNEFCVISVRSVFHRNHNILPFSIRKKINLVPKEYYDEIERFKGDIADIADTIIENYGYNIRFLNTYIGKQMSASDDSFTLSVIEKMKEKNRSFVNIIDVNYFPREIKGVLSKARFIISVPLHPLILGASESVPIFSLAYASKNKCFMQQINCSRYIYKVENIGDKLDKHQLMLDILETMKQREQYILELKAEVDRNKERELKNKYYLMDLLLNDK